MDRAASLLLEPIEQRGPRRSEKLGIMRFPGSLRVSASLALALALMGGAPGRCRAQQRDLYNTVNVAAAAFIYPDSFRSYVDSTGARGFRSMRVAGAWRLKCWQCAPDTIDIDTNPAPGLYDFSTYFNRLDYAITTKGMKMQLVFALCGRLATDPVSPGAQRVLPPFLGAGDVMLYRNSSGQDVIFSGGWETGNYTKSPRFEKASVRLAILDFVTAVVTQFGARYGNAITGYCFTVGEYNETEYPILDYPYFCDTSPEAAQAFRAWLARHYDSPQAVSAAWRHHPAFQSFDEIQILDGQGPPALGRAPQAYLDFMAYREEALGTFLRDLRDRIHAAGGHAVAQIGSNWDVLSAGRGTFGFGREIAGYDLVIVDDGPDYDHRYSMDYTRTNSPGVPFGNELDAPCRFACGSTIDQCCYWPTFPAHNDVPAGNAGMDAQVSQSYERGAAWVDFANWDNFYHKAFDLYAAALANAVSQGSQTVTAPVASDTQRVSLRALYVKHHDGAYIDSLVAAHAALGGSSRPVAVLLDYDLAPLPVVGVPLPLPATSLTLAPPLPNPANGRVSLSFALPARARVSFKLFDAAGRSVATLVECVLEPGEHHAALDALRFPAGVYLCRLEAAGEVRTRKIEIAR